MVIDSETGEPLHELTDEGWEVHTWLRLRDEMFRASHPILHSLSKLLGKAF